MNTMTGALMTKLGFPRLPQRYGKAPYFWLLSLVMMVWKFVYVTPTTTEILLLSASILLFLPLYLWSFSVQQSQLYSTILMTALLGIGWAPFNFGSSTFCIFAASMCSRISPGRSAYRVLALLQLSVVAATVLLALPPQFWVTALVFGTSVGVSAIIAAQLDLSKESLLRKQEEVEYLATLAERERIARDMHDLLGHNLSVITLKAELARKLFERDAVAAKQEIQDIEQTARQALHEVRQAISGYRSAGLSHEIKNARHVLDAAQIQVVTELEELTLPAALENVMALILREAVTNIIRHAQASICVIQLRRITDQAVLSIRDDGIAGSLSALKKGNGMLGMLERAHSVGGQLTLDTSQGMQIVLSLPMEVQA